MDGDKNIRSYDCPGTLCYLTVINVSEIKRRMRND